MRPSPEASSAPPPSVVLYGGAFDPPHAGHTGCVRLVLERLPAATVRVLPTYAPPGVSGAAKTAVAPFDDRVAMCRLAFEPLGPRVTVEAWEKDLPAPSYTARTLQHAQSLLPGQRLGFLVGQDQVGAFHLWKDPLAILERATLLVVARREPGQALEVTRAALRLDIEAMAERLGLATPDGHVLTLEGDLSDAASQAIRKRYANGADIPTGWLQPAVARYAAERQLYRQTSAKP